MGEEDIHISIWDLKGKIRSVILDWRQRSSGCSNEGDRSTSLSSEGRDLLVTQADLSVPRVCSPSVALLHKKGPRYRRKICANSLWLYSYYSQSSPSKNKNINYIFLYLRVLRCLSSNTRYNACIGKCFLLEGEMFPRSGTIWSCINYHILLGRKMGRARERDILWFLCGGFSLRQVILYQDLQIRKFIRG